MILKDKGFYNYFKNYQNNDFMTTLNKKKLLKLKL